MVFFVFIFGSSRELYCVFDSWLFCGFLDVFVVCYMCDRYYGDIFVWRGRCVDVKWKCMNKLNVFFVVMCGFLVVGRIYVDVIIFLY